MRVPPVVSNFSTALQTFTLGFKTEGNQLHFPTPEAPESRKEGLLFY